MYLFLTPGLPRWFALLFYRIDLVIRGLQNITTSKGLVGKASLKEASVSSPLIGHGSGVIVQLARPVPVPVTIKASVPLIVPVTLGQFPC